ncbi:MAG TPA: ThiF family adenylyltransferase [Acidimicrobiia bacterium]|nr:ThiF family adenylyltransferase [Acidimicrobiia bacterium]
MTLSYHEAVARAKQEIREITAAELVVGSGVLVVDVREPYEFRSGTIPGAVSAPLAEVAATVAGLAPETATEVVFICTVGNRSALAAKELQDRGYRNVASLAGGVAAWRAGGRELVLPVAADDAGRHLRQQALPEIGVDGQRLLGAARVIVVGAGALGSPVLLYLAGAGVGTLAVVDHDVVELSNLHRQVVHRSGDVGRTKVASAADTVAAIDPAVRVMGAEVRLTIANAAELLRGFDLVVDGSDNFEARYAINDAAVALGIPMVHGAVYRWEGQVTVLDPRRGPCYRCLFPRPPAPGAAPDCDVAGVFGAVPGVIGSLMAVEAAKLLLDVGNPLVGRLLMYDGLSGDFTRLEVLRSADCPRHSLSG